MDNKTIIILGAVGTLAFILFRKIRGYADMAQQISFVAMTVRLTDMRYLPSVANNACSIRTDNH